MLVHGGVTLTFIPAGPAHRGTRLQDASRDIRVIAGVPRNEARRDTANINAIFAGPSPTHRSKISVYASGRVSDYHR